MRAAELAADAALAARVEAQIGAEAHAARAEAVRAQRQAWAEEPAGALDAWLHEGDAAPLELRPLRGIRVYDADTSRSRPSHHRPLAAMAARWRQLMEAAMVGGHTHLTAAAARERRANVQFWAAADLGAPEPPAPQPVLSAAQTQAAVRAAISRLTVAAAPGAESPPLGVPDATRRLARHAPAPQPDASRRQRRMEWADAAAAGRRRRR